MTLHRPRPLLSWLCGGLRQCALAALPAVCLFCGPGASQGAGLTPEPSSTVTDQPAPQRTTTPPSPAQGLEALPAVPPEPGQPTTAPSQPPAEGAPSGEPAPAWPPAPGQNQTAVSAQKVRSEAGKILAEGNVTVKTPELTVTSQKAELDENQEWATFSGDVSIETKTTRSTADTLRVNLDTEAFDITQGRTRIEPSFFQEGQFVTPLFMQGREVTGAPEGGPVTLRNGLLTSCDLPNPHYGLSSSRIIVIPNRKVIITKPSLEIFGHRLFRFPFDLVLGLDQNQNRFLPEIGQNEVEGYYAKMAFLYLAGALGEGFLRLQMTQKRGLGLGVDHSIDTPRQTGEASLFFEPSQGSISARINDRLQLSDTIETNFSTSYQNDTGYSGNNSSLSSDLTFARRSGTTRTQLGLQRSSFGSDLSSSNTFSTNFTHEQGAYDNHLSLRTSLRNSSYSVSTPADRQLETELDWTRSTALFDFNAYVDDRRQLGDSPASSSFFSLNRLPEFAVRTDSDRMSALNFLRGVKTDATLYVGRYTQDPDGISVYRATFDGRFAARQYRLGANAQMSNQLQFRQSFYSDGSAQYALQFYTELRQKLGNLWNTRLTYNFATVQGFAPLRLDYSGRNNNFYAEAVRIVSRRSRLDLATGYDLLGNIWRDAVVRYELMTARDSKFQLQSGYSLQNSQWRPLDARWVKAGDRFYSALGINYDLAQQRLTRTTAELDWMVTPLWRVELLAGYNGYSKNFDTLDLQITRDLHCWVATLAYDNSLKEVRFNLGIKAFPSNERTLGIGRSGAMFESSMGNSY